MSPCKPFDLNGGDERVRTAGLLLARQALSQLSYTPAFVLRCLRGLSHFHSIRFSQGTRSLKTVQFRTYLSTLRNSFRPPAQIRDLIRRGFEALASLGFTP